MKKISIAILLCSALLCSAQEKGTGAVVAATPPMGWNSWDSYGTTIKETEVRTTAQWMAQHLKAYGWEYVVVDMEWFVTNPTPGGNSEHSQFAIDGYGRYVPAEN